MSNVTVMIQEVRVGFSSTNDDLRDLILKYDATFEQKLMC